MKQLEIKIDLVSDWQKGIYNWYVENYGKKWRFVEARNATLEAAVLRHDFASVPMEERGTLVCYYYNLYHRIVPPTKRKLIVLDQEHLFANIASDKIEDVKLGWAAFSSDVDSGLNLDTRQTDKRFDIDGKDVLLDRFKIHHFHIRVDPKKRGDYVAYCFVTNDAVKVITIDTHRAAFGRPETCQAIVEKAYELYPEEFVSFKINENVRTVPIDLDAQKKMSWLNINAPFWIGDKQFYPIGMGAMMNGVSMEAQRGMMRDQRLFSAANKAMKKFAEDNISVIEQTVSESATSVTFRLFSKTGPVVEARSEDQSLRITYDIITNTATLSCIDILAKRLEAK
ncbi:MAG: hypothetical protein Q4G55_00070 [bacterium]|nr:hypothetical protein [bacterium]